MKKDEFWTFVEDGGERVARRVSGRISRDSDGNRIGYYRKETPWRRGFYWYFAIDIRSGHGATRGCCESWADARRKMGEALDVARETRGTPYYASLCEEFRRAVNRANLEGHTELWNSEREAAHEV